MPESPDYYRGAIAVLEKRGIGHSEVRDSLRDDYRARLGALPSPVEAPTDLPRGKPLVYEDPSPDYWDLVEKCEAVILEGTHFQVLGPCQAGVVNICRCLDCKRSRADGVLYLIRAARQARGK